MSLRMMKRMRSAAVAGFGGHPALPPIYAATAHDIPAVIHEATGVLGRAKRLLGLRVEAIANGFSGPPLPCRRHGSRSDGRDRRRR
jgi:UDP-N-acetylglucosamine--N-acetylmuramyl-(pentapeptide) pyrophosphoryl-undecaprenol N-acetylglucosamine transferase